MKKSTHFYEVDVTAYAQLAPRTFTYSYESPIYLAPGQIVQVPFGRRTSLGIITSISQPSAQLKPKIKPIESVIDNVILPDYLLAIASWLKEYYAATSHAVWSAILPSGITVKKRKSHPNPNPTPARTPLDPKTSLSTKQEIIFQSILTATKPILLSGVTGSGKTHIYEKLIAYHLDQNKSVLYLSPEIFLTQQLEKRLSRLFHGTMTLSHSGLTAAQRRNIWLDCLTSVEGRLYLGPRSSLFLPLHNLGLIIIDEAHDTSYKQESTPRYQAREVAAKLSQITGAQLVLGSATHDIVTTRLAQLGRLEIAELYQRHQQRELPTIQTIDMKGVFTPLSPELIAAINRRLECGQQSLLLHNRRGSARRLTCEDCGSTQICPRCDTSLVFHADEARLRCHACNYSQFPPSICPICGSSNLHYHGFGTKQLAQEVQQRFPNARLARIDRDEANKGSLKDILSDAESGTIDILIGTQMIAKGLNFPQVTLVGIVAGDELLFGDDYQSRERGVALIMQAAGRAGRGDIPGEVLIQTRQPQSLQWSPILSHDWHSFVHDELTRRQKFHYPPYQYLARINFLDNTPDKALKRASTWLQDIHAPRVTFLGPATPNHARSNLKCTAHIICKTSYRKDLTQLASHLPRDANIDIDPISIF